MHDLLKANMEAAVVAVPTALHEEVAATMAEAGVHVLIEKPLADTRDAADRICNRFNSEGLLGAVGHVERFNPALIEMKKRLLEGELGQVFSINTERVGPFPGRVQDVGVIKDLATHDIDICMWLGDGDFETVSGHMAHKMGRPHEDLVSAVGRLTGGVVATMMVNWLTPTKRRTVTVLGERGAFVADLLAADLYFYANADVPSEWDEMARLKGVSEGDMVRYALRKREPLRVELEAFGNAIHTGVMGSVVSLEEGVRILAVAEAILESSAGRMTSP
jgi:predicted dehydrogenase